MSKHNKGISGLSPKEQMRRSNWKTRPARMDSKQHGFLSHQKKKEKKGK